MKQPDCQAGCLSLAGGDIKHDKNCVHYPESMTAMIDTLTVERDEADRAAGAATRLLENARETIYRADQWKNEQKLQAGYRGNDSFDVVWKETLEKARNSILKAEVASAVSDAVSAIYFDDKSDMEKALYEVVRHLDAEIYEVLNSSPKEAWAMARSNERR